MAIDLAIRKILPTAGNDLNHFISSFATDLLLTQALAYDASGNTEYVGFALPGTAKTASRWLIKKLTYGANGVTDIQFAEGDASFSYVWNSRAGYTYS